MRTWPYFVPEDDELPCFTDDERAFAAVLSEATVPLICSEVNDLLIPSVIARDFQQDNGLVAALCLQARACRGSGTEYSTSASPTEGTCPRGPSS